ncbi:hypothetical protein [Streptomyces sp. AD55]|uniref:hypothetical protein n=1 Tax=Streptomyces sp. AD55 TaxID=3242895 RepID=UPI0035279548
MERPATGTAAMFPLTDADAGPYGITVGPDGAVWAALETGALARVTPRWVWTPFRTEPRGHGVAGPAAAPRASRV